MILSLSCVLVQCRSRTQEVAVQTGFDNMFRGREKHLVVMNRSEEFSRFPRYRFYFTASVGQDQEAERREVMAVVGVDDNVIRYIEYRKSGVDKLSFLLSDLRLDDLKGDQRLTQQLCELVQEVAVGLGCVIWTADRRNYFYYIDDNLKEVDVGFLHKAKVNFVGDGRAEIRFFSTALNRLMRNSIIVAVTDKGIKVVSYSEKSLCNMIERP